MAHLGKGQRVTGTDSYCQLVEGSKGSSHSWSRELAAQGDLPEQKPDHDQPLGDGDAESVGDGRGLAVGLHKTHRDDDDNWVDFRTSIALFLTALQSPVGKLNQDQRFGWARTVFRRA